MARLTYQERKNLPAKSFVFPSSRAYPIPDKPHARAALQEVAGARSGKPASKAKQAEVRAAVHRKFPSIGKGKK